MYGTILGAVAPVLLTALVGYLWTRNGRSFDAPTMTLLATEIGTPCLVFATYVNSTIPPGAFTVTAAAGLTIITACFVIASLVLRVCGLSLKTYLPSMVFGNTGNLGIPLALYAFGPQGLSYAIVFVTITSIANFTVGQGIAAGTVDWRGIARMPIIYAVVLGVGTSALGIELPRWLLNTVTLLGNIAVPLMLLMLGASLGRLRVAAFPRAFALSILRIGMGASVGFAVTALFGLHGLARAALIQQSAMPAAVFNYLFALRYDNQPEEVAGIVVISTLAAIVTAPALLYFLLQ
jgi:predicted permease